MKKKMFLVCLGLLFGVLTAMAQEAVHVVKRGETLTMIATQYGVSVDALKAANPLVGKTLFVGMKLQIPEKVIIQEDVTTPSDISPTNLETEISNTADGVVEEEYIQKTYHEGGSKSQSGEWVYFGTLGFDFLELGKMYSKFNNYTFDLHWNYVAPSNVYIGPGFGYTYTFIHDKSYDSDDQEMALRIPIRIGYQLPIAKQSKIMMDFGPSMNCVIWGRREMKDGTKSKFKDWGEKRFGVSAVLGLHVLINENFGLGVRYTTSFKNFMDEGFFGVSLVGAIDTY